MGGFGMGKIIMAKGTTISTKNYGSNAVSVVFIGRVVKRTMEPMGREVKISYCSSEVEPKDDENKLLPV